MRYQGHGLLRGKKGIFFTLTAILIVTMFVMYFKLQVDIPLKAKLPVAESRINSMNDFVKSFEEIYAPRALYAMSHNAMNCLFLYLNDTNKDKSATERYFFSNISLAFKEAVNDSRIYGKGNSIIDLKAGCGMQNMQFWMGKLANTTKKELGADFNFTIDDIYLEQDYETGPWKVRAVMKIRYMINSSGIAKWERNPGPISAEFDVSDFIDPYIAVMSHGYLNRRINTSALTPRQINTEQQFRDIVTKGQYVFENYTAPSFLFRFEGNTSPSYCCGMESFVHPDIADPEALDKDIYSNSYLDFEYWRGRCYLELEDPEAYLLLPEDKTLWIPEEVYPGFGYLKMDSYHRFNVYPNIGSSFITVDEYNHRHSLDAGFVAIAPGIRCNPVPTYSNPDGI